MSDELLPSSSPSSTDPLLGRAVAGRFQIQELIARGSMGKVYRATQLPLERPVALKILDVRADKVTGEGFASRFLREASVLARLNHANTVRVYDYGLWEGHSFLVMELIAGSPLSDLIAEGALPPARALNIGVQICGALREAHQQGIIHRDLKPSNILISQQSGVDFAKLIDFGLGKELEQDAGAELTMAGQILGSPMYMSPEQIRARDVDQRTDIYALGVVLYRALVGQRPYLQQGTPALMFAHLNESPRAFAVANPELRLPPCVEWTVMRCLEKAPEARFGDAGELQRALRACQIALESPSCWNLTLSLQGGVTVLPPELSDINADSLVLAPPRLPPPPAPARNPTPALIAALIGMMVLIGIGSIWYAVSQRPTASPASPVQAAVVAPLPPAPPPTSIPAPEVQPPAPDLSPEDAPLSPAPDGSVDASPALPATPPPPPVPSSSTPKPRGETPAGTRGTSAPEAVAKPPVVSHPPNQTQTTSGSESGSGSDLKDPWEN